jgi:hypothetical protein
VNRSGTICGTAKSGPGGITPAALLEMTAAAKRIGIERIQKLDVALGQTTKTKSSKSNSAAAAANNEVAASATTMKDK